MPTGTVKFVGPGGSWGFISRDDREPKVFVHLGAVVAAGSAALAKGQRFSFDLEVGSTGGPRATNLHELASAPSKAPSRRRSSVHPAEAHIAKG